MTTIVRPTYSVYHFGLPTGTTEVEAVVAIVRVTGTVVVEDVKSTLVGLKLQALSGGKP
jgi:hypothetical protein